MPEQEYELRPDTETFECAGCRVALVGAADILTAARTERVELLHSGRFPWPVRRLQYTVGTQPRAGQHDYLLEAEIDSGGAGGGLPPDWLRTVVLGPDPLGVLLTRRMAAGDPWAARIVDGVGYAAAETYRRLGLGRPGGSEPLTGSSVRTDEDTGLRATVTRRPSGGGGTITTLHATVPGDEMTPAPLRAMFCLALAVVAEQVSDGRQRAPLAGRSYVLSLRPGGLAADPDDTYQVDLDQVGGLSEIVAQFREIAVSFRHPEVMARWGARRPQGIMMYGPPGTGKTMLARALANEIGARFREIRTPEILDKWLGASERNIKRIFRDARRYREPTVMLFDEFDSIISYAGLGGDAASQAVNAVAGIFKQEMNSLIEINPNVIVVATTNFPDRVDDSLIRSGRFDVKLAVPPPDEAGRAEIITKMIRSLIARYEMPGFRMFGADVDPHELARASDGMTGADLKEALRRIQLTKAMQEARTGVAAAPISQADLQRCLADLRRTAPGS